jgi:hypothetical protein
MKVNLPVEFKVGDGWDETTYILVEMSRENFNNYLEEWKNNPVYDSKWAPFFIRVDVEGN